MAEMHGARLVIAPAQPTGEKEDDRVAFETRRDVTGETVGIAFTNVEQLVQAMGGNPAVANGKVKALREAPVDSLSFVGKSWRNRGFPYWAGRAFVVLFMLLMTGMVIALAIGITIGIVNAGAPPWVVVPVVVVASASSSYQSARSIVRKQREDTALGGHELEPGSFRTSSERDRARRAGGSAGALGYGLSALGGLGSLFVAVCVPIAVGIFPVFLWYWLKPLAPGELRARRKLARWLTLQGRQGEIPAGWEIS